MPDTFALDERLAADTTFVADWPLCRVLLMEDANYPWLVLVPRRAGLRDLHDLDDADAAAAMAEIRRAGSALAAACAPDKMNVAALGNQVPQLHVHVIARFTGDAAWPRPIWGAVPARPYDDAGRTALLDAFNAAVAAAG